jgi:hypothetical protein
MVLKFGISGAPPKQELIIISHLTHPGHFLSIRLGFSCASTGTGGCPFDFADVALTWRKNNSYYNLHDVTVSFLNTIYMNGDKLH